MIKTINFAPGDIVRVHEEVKEIPASDAKDKTPKTRVQVFEGTVLRVGGRGNGKSFSVRKLVEGIGVEKTWPLLSPSVEKVTLKAHPKSRIRRSKLYYLRSKFN